MQKSSDVDLFSEQKLQNRLRAQPLAVRMRPQSLGEFVGQQHFLGEYPHDSPGGMVLQDYLGVDKIYYEPTDRGAEAALADYVKRIRTVRQRSGADTGEQNPAREGGA